jgi:hypothetical protein
MSGPAMRNPVPAWLRPENASVLDSGMERVIKMLAGLIGADDPNSQVLGIAAPVEVPGGVSPITQAINAIAKRIPNPIKAFHGSPHDFDQFSLSKIGTGEGAQAFGHGGYFGEAPDTGRSYRDSVGAAHAGGARTYDPELKVGGKRIEDVYASLESAAARMPIEKAQGQYDRLALLEDLGHDGDVLAVRERIKQGAYSPEAVAWFEKEVAPKFTRKGRLYEVNIHADPEQMLDWDKPLSQQSEAVRKALKAEDAPQLQSRLDEIRAQSEAMSKDRLPDNRMRDERGWHALMDEADTIQSKLKRMESGAAAYEHAVDLADTGKRGTMTYKERRAVASENLRKAGIPGIKYLDGASRSAGEGSRNYVIFDDKLIEIVKKYGIAGAVSAGLINQAQAQQLQEQGYQ